MLTLILENISNFLCYFVYISFSSFFYSLIMSKGIFSAFLKTIGSKLER